MNKVKENKDVVIKVVGAGGAGGNAINHMIDKKVSGVSFIAANTDVQDLKASEAGTKIQMGPKLTSGLGAGSNPKVGYKAAQESSEDISAALKGANMVFVTAGMGGGTGTGSAPVIAKIARAQGALTVGVVSKPWLFEGPRRSKFAREGLKNLKKNVDTLIPVDNNKILEVVGKKAPFSDACKVADDVLCNGVRGITNLITNPGYVNLDFADITTAMKNKGYALMGVGTSSSSKRTVEATRQAISSPLLEVSVRSAKQVLLNIAGGPDLSLYEAQKASEVVTDATSQNVNIIFGTSIDKQLGDRVRVTVIATGIDKDSPKAESHKSTPKQTSSQHTEGVHMAQPHRNRVTSSRIARPRFFQHDHSYKINNNDDNDNGKGNSKPNFRERFLQHRKQMNHDNDNYMKNGHSHHSFLNDFNFGRN